MSETGVILPEGYQELMIEALQCGLAIQAKGFELCEVVNKARAQFGEGYYQWLTELSGTLQIEPKTLDSSAIRYQKAIDDGWFRRELSPGHHAEVDNKKLDVNDRSELLDKAIAGRWTCAVLREAVRDRIGLSTNAKDDDDLTDLRLYQQGYARRAELLEKILETVELPEELRAEIEKELLQ